MSFRKKLLAIVSGLAIAVACNAQSFAQTSGNFENGVRNNEGWNFLNAARNFDSYFDQGNNCLSQDRLPSFQCIDARLESALNFINAGKVNEGETRIKEARSFAGSVGDPGVSQDNALNFGSLYARTYQYDALKDLRQGASATDIAAKTASARRYRQQIRDGLRSFDGRAAKIEDNSVSVDASGNIVISRSLSDQISPKFDVGPVSRTENEIGTTYGRFSSTRGQQLAVQDAQSYLIEAYAYGREKNRTLALQSLRGAERALNSPRGAGNSLDPAISVARAPFLWAMIKGEIANHEVANAAGNQSARSKIINAFEDEVIQGVFRNAYQDSKLRGLMFLRLAELRAQNGEFTKSGGTYSGLSAVENGISIIRSNVDNPTVDTIWVEPLLSAVYDNRSSINNWERKFYDIMQIASQSEVAADAAEAVIRLKEDEGSPLGQALRDIDRLQFAYRDADRELEVMRTRRLDGEGIPDDVFQIKQDQVAELANQLSVVRTRFQDSADGKRFAQLVSTSVDLNAIQTTLDSDEAYSRIVLGQDRGYSLLITSKDVTINSIETSRKAIQKSVETLRCSVDFVDLYKRYECSRAWTGAKAYDGTFPEFDVKLASNLFENIYGDSKEKILNGGIKHLIIQPDAVLASLPFAALVTTAPSAITASSVTHINGANDTYNHDYTKVDWLSDKVAVSHSVGELSFVQARDKRKSGIQSNASKPFLAFSGFERFDEGEAQMISKANDVDANSCGDVYRGFLDIAESTDRQAAAIQSRIGGDVLSGTDFTDTNVLSYGAGGNAGSDLKDYKVLLFATHAKSPGPLTKGCLNEPVLMTNIEQGNPDSDGLLTASDIASGLELNADLVILSACETAVGSQVSTFSDRPTAETFDGIVRAFYFAQAQSLLATHWTLPANETVTVFSQLFDQEGLADTAFAERLRQTQVSVRNGTFEGQSTSHPYFWANFVFVGDGRAELKL